MLTAQQSKKWTEIFGAYWDEITKICPEMGGFMIDHREKAVVLDDNSIRLAEVDEIPDYETMMDLLVVLERDSKAFSRLFPLTFYQDGDYTAGILRWHYDFSGIRAKSVVPVLDRYQLSHEIKHCDTRSLFALLEFKLSDNHELSEAHLFGAMAAVIRALPDGAVFCPNYKNCFWLFVPEVTEDSERVLKKVQDIVINSGQAARLGGKAFERYITFSAGIGAEEGTPEQRMSTAQYALYEANMSGEGLIAKYSSEQYELNKVKYERMSRFLRLVNENLFIYHFQPIVSAKTGEIIAYEMLMRSDASIGMFPLEILDCAEKTDRLYDIERATMTNALAIIEKNQDVFKKRKLFVNAISSHLLNDEDWNGLVERYGELMEKMVVELTEQSEIGDERIDQIRMRLVHSNVKIAIDDFGTGYSNTTNLIKYVPDVVKIDRSLIEGINTKPTIRKLVSGIIEFIHENGYQALAEGVETYEELQTMIQLESDLIQGYYVSKPKPVMVYEVSDNVRRDIETINLINSGSISRPYHPIEGETVDLLAVKTEGYNSVFIETENVFLKGRTDIYLDTVIVVKSGIKSRITLENVRIKSGKDSPTLSIGDGSDVEVIVDGDNILDGRGIYVPKMSSLYLTGLGDISILSNNEDCYGIGVDRNSSPGNIVIDTRGHVIIKANGDTVTAIGGGKNDAKTVIKLLGGEYSISCTGGSCIGIGIADGGSIVDLENCSCNIDISAPDVVGVGSFKGGVDVSMKNFKLVESLNGISVVGVGTIENGTGGITMYSGVVESVLKGRLSNCIGTRNGSIDTYIRQSFITLYSESGSVSGIGDMLGAGNVTLEQTRLNFDFRTGTWITYGSRSGELKCSEVEETIKINE